MIKKQLLEEALGVAMMSGADFAEIYVERTKTNNVYMINSQVEQIRDGVISGIGIRVLKGLRSVYASSSSLDRESVIRLAENVASVLGEGKSEISINLTERIFGDVHKISVVPSSAETKTKIELLKRAYFSARDYDKLISQVQGSLMDTDHNILIANSEGLLTTDRQIRTRMSISSVASDNGENQSGGASPGRRMGLEMFETILPEDIGTESSRQALVNLRAGYCPAGKMPVAIENGFGGVIFHEACGHSLEATSVAVGASQFCGKLGEMIASEKVTAIDDGTIPNAWGSINIDDEGTPSRRNVLIENGVLKSYMIDRFGGRRMGMAPTGNSRRQGYSYEPTSRMTNTFIAAGNDDNNDIISSIEYGLYAKSMGGGSVNPVTGAFNFAVREGYMIRGGKICEAVRGASLIGTGSEIIKNIDMVGTDLETGQGMCGSSSGSIPTDVGQPLIRVSEITVGGRK